MAMTKAEKAEMERLRANLTKAKALRWPDYRPEVLDTTEALKGKSLVPAWGFSAWREGTVHYGCFSSIYHSVHNHERTSSQGRGGPWFPTKRDALMALRIAKTEEFATILANIDRQIAEAEGE